MEELHAHIQVRMYSYASVVQYISSVSCSHLISTESMVFSHVYIKVKQHSVYFIHFDATNHESFHVNTTTLMTFIF